MKPWFGSSLCYCKGPSTSLFLSLSAPTEQSHSWSRNTEPWGWTLLAINCWETAFFLIKASTSHLREVKVRSASESVCRWLCVTARVYTSFYACVCFVCTTWKCVRRCASVCITIRPINLRVWKNLTLPSPAQILSPLTLWEQFIKPLISCYSLQTIRSND